MSINPIYLASLNSDAAASSAASNMPQDGLHSEFQKLIDPTLNDLRDAQQPATTRAVPVPEQDKDKKAKIDSKDSKNPEAKAAVFEQSLNSNPEAETAQPVVADQDFSIGDLIDVLNPLQNLPIIGSIYRFFSGDQITGTARVAGGLLYGGPLGLLVATSNAIYAQEHGGNDLGMDAMASIMGDDKSVPMHDVAQNSDIVQQLPQNPADTASDTATATKNVSDTPAPDAQNLAELPNDIAATPLLESESIGAVPTANLPPAPEAAAPSASIAPAAAPVTVAPAQMPDAMMRALDKYEALLRERNQGKVNSTR